MVFAFTENTKKLAKNVLLPIFADEYINDIFFTCLNVKTTIYWH